MNQTLLFSIIIGAPLVGAIVTALLKKTQGLFATIMCFASALAALGMFFTLPSQGSVEFSLFPWITIADISIDFGFRIDALSMIMVLLVTWVGGLIHLFAMGYMHDDPAQSRFFAYLNLFIFSMLTLVTGANLLVLFIGWEGVGLCSYLLIGFWFSESAFAKAGQKAFVMNRIGDLGMLLAMFVLLRDLGTLDFLALKGLFVGGAPLSDSILFLIGIALFFGACGKSAQLPLFTWLPDAMAGPTPVSALIHAATMVTAGVYLMARMSFLFDATPEVMSVVILIGALTAIIAATAALGQRDLKKLLAYSTVSQLGFMFVAAGAGAYWIALFHVLTHAFFKACLFLSAGSVIHACDGEQQMEKMGGLFKKMPITAMAYLCSVIAIAGIYPSSGYFSKHGILDAVELVSGSLPFGHFALYLLKITSFITAFYMMKSFCLTFLGTYRGDAHPHEGSWLFTVPVAFLGGLAVMSGYLLKDQLPVYLSGVLLNDPLQHDGNVLIASALGIFGVIAGFVFFRNGSDFLRGPSWSRIQSTLEASWGFDYFYRAIFGGISQIAARISDRVLHGMVGEGLTEGAQASAVITGEMVRALQSGFMKAYGVLMVLAAAILLAWYVVG